MHAFENALSVFREEKFTFGGENMRGHGKRAKYYPFFIILRLASKHKEKTKDTFHRAERAADSKGQGRTEKDRSRVLPFPPLSSVRSRASLSPSQNLPSASPRTKGRPSEGGAMAEKKPRQNRTAQLPLMVCSD